MDNQIELLTEFDNHKLVSFISQKNSNLRAYIALHRGSLSQPSFGATRISHYSDPNDALRDVLRLSKLMSYKSVMAGLNYGGAKGVIMAPVNLSSSEKVEIIKAYTEYINYFNGSFVTGADVGVSKEDLSLMKNSSDFIVGAKSDPVLYTARGLFNGIEVSVREYYGTLNLNQRSIAIQGVGKIGSALLKLLYNRMNKIVIADINIDRVKKVAKRFPNVKVVSPSMIYKQKVDIFAPCALGDALTPHTITQLRAPIIVGGANNQLQSSAVGELLHSLGILYAPDYVVNAGGLIAVVDEYEHKQFNSARTKKRLANITKVLSNIYLQSRSQNKATNLIADQIAESLIN